MVDAEPGDDAELDDNGDVNIEKNDDVDDGVVGVGDVVNGGGGGDVDGGDDIDGVGVVGVVDVVTGVVAVGNGGDGLRDGRGSRATIVEAPAAFACCKYAMIADAEDPGTNVGVGVGVGVGTAVAVDIAVVAWRL